MGIMDRLNKPAPAATPPARPAAPPARGASRFGGINAAAPRNAIPEAGIYRMRVVAVSEGYNPGKDRSSAKISLEIVAIASGGENHREGEEVFVTFPLSGNGRQAGASKFMAFVLAAAGYTDQASYDEYDPQHLLPDALLGAANGYAERAAQIVGSALVDVEVKRGKAIVDQTTQQPTGDYYREFTWEPSSDG